MEKIELLAPAGDLERLKIAYLYGADACYIGGKRFSLRANASNFDIDEIREAISYAHRLGKKIYVTVNILFHEEDIDGVYDYLRELDDILVDAVIIADPFLIPWIKNNCKNLAIFLSTQASTSNVEAVKFFLMQGVDRIVLARELSKEEIRDIYLNTHAHLEVFLHGAMCTCVSGRCLLSNYFTNRDSNRGGCSQVCRFSFDLDKKRKKEFSIASKDLNLASHIKNLIEIGVGSLKIEGRMRSAYYIATVISSYRKLIDAYYNNSYSDELVKKEEVILARVANRTSSSQFFDHKNTAFDQYYLGRNEISNQDFLGIVKGYDTNKKMIEIEQRNYFKVGDAIHIFGPNGFSYDMVCDEIYNQDMESVSCANHPKEILWLKVDQSIPKNSFLRVSFEVECLDKKVKL